VLIDDGRHAFHLDEQLDRDERLWIKRRL
jgi:hypothetical protein